jgi:hypothetical protein
MPGRFLRIFMFNRRNYGLISLFCWCVTSSVTLAGPKIWIFNGDPGDEKHHEKYQKSLADLTKSLTVNYRIPPEAIRVFYGPRESGYEGICTKEVMLAELKKAAEATRDANCDGVWIVIQGHSNSIPGGTLFNIPGPDISPREMAIALKDAAEDKPIVLFATTTASEPFIKALAAPGRIVIAANSKGDHETETDFPLALHAALAAKSTDANEDGFVTATEIFTACHAWIETMNTSKGYVIVEHSQMDGNGDGRGTSRPAVADAEPASKVGLRLGGEQEGKSFD